MSGDEPGPRIVPVALVMPLRNEAHAMADFFDAYLKFTVRPCEIVFVDTGSTDDTRDVVTAWCAGLRDVGTSARMATLPGGLPGAGRNRGVELSTSPWVAFLDAGIRPEADWLERLFEQAGRSGVTHVLGGCRFDSRDSVGLAVCALTNGVGRIRPVLPASLFSRMVFAEAGGFNASLRAGEDILWLARVRSVCGDPVLCLEARVHYLRYPETLSAAMAKWRRYEASLTGTTVGRRKRGLLVVAAILAAAVLPLAPDFAIPGLAAYLLARGVIDPVRRSGSLTWWRRRPMAACIAPVAALALDGGSLAGTLSGLLRRWRRHAPVATR